MDFENHAQEDSRNRMNTIIRSLLRLQFNPFQNVIVVTGSDFHDLQETGRVCIAEHLSDTLQKDVLWVQDGTQGIDRYFVGPPEDFITGNRMLMNIDGRAILVNRPESQEKPQGTNEKAPARVKISRPPNAYILYRTDHCRLIKAANPGYSNNQISKVLGAAWREEQQDVRARYQRRADELREELMRTHPEYRYSPRRPGERRRRHRRDTVQELHQTALSQSTSPASEHA